MIEQLGTSPLFLGVETGSWTLADFENAGRNAHNLGCTSLLVKIADGGNLWHGNLGGWQKVVDVVSSTGVRCIPYAYCYGDKFNAIHSEIAILTEAMQHSGVAIGDLEQEYNGQVGWASALADALKPVKGIFGVTTWADPQLQNWHGVLAALKPAVNFWLPQVYSDYLASVYHAQFDQYGLPYYPILNLGTDAGPNNIVQIAKESNSVVVGFWEYEPAIGAYANTVKEVVAMSKAKLPVEAPQSPPAPLPKPAPTPQPPQPQQTGAPAMDIHDPYAAQYFQEQDAGKWYCPRTRQYIIGDILKYYLKIWGAVRLPLSGEQTDIAGIKWQTFEAGVIIFDPSHVHDRPTSESCYLAKLDDPIVTKLLQGQQVQTASTLTTNAQAALDALLANFSLQKETASQMEQDAQALAHGADAASVTVANIRAALVGK